MMYRTLPALLIACLGAVSQVQAFNILSPGDPIIAIDLDFETGSNSPGGEQAPLLLDGDTATKYLNFGTSNTGFIVTPDASNALQSFVLSTANDFEARDPASYIVYGTNDPITSVAHGNGRAENWTEISSGALALPVDREVDGDVVGFANATSYSSYKMVFPTTKTADTIMQVSNAYFFSSDDGSGTTFLGASNPIIPIRDVDPGPVSDSPAAEAAPFAIDRDVNTKYLNFAEENSGFIVTPTAGPTVVNSFQITTANDADARDPASWELRGTNEAITTENNGIGDEQNWTLIDSGTLDLPLDRLTESAVITVNNTAGPFTSYRMVFPTVRDEANANSMQIAEIALFATDEATIEVNRQTGEVVLEAVDNIEFKNYEVRSSDTNGLVASEWDSLASTNGDPDDTWTETSATSDILSEEDSAGGADNGFTLTAGNTLSLGEIWQILPTAFEDLGVTFVGADDLPVGVGVEFTGTEIPFGDYSGNGTVGSEDWPMFIAGYGGDYTGMSPAQAYLGGDLDGDFDSDIYDFNLFVEAAGGMSALFGNQQIPEPSTIALVGLAVAGFAVRRFRKPLATAAAALACLLCIPQSGVQAQTFTNVGGAPVSATIPAGQMNETLATGPMQLFDDDFLDDPGVIDGELFLLDYNDPDLTGGPYFQYAGLGGEPKTVFFDYGSNVTANWFAYSQRSGADPTADRVGKFEFWFSGSDFGGTVPATAPDAVIELLPDDPRLLDSALRPYSLSGSHSGQYVAMRLSMSALSANQPTTNIGGHEFRLLSGPSDVVLEVDRSNGSVTLNNNLTGAQSIELKSYTIESPSGALDSAAFDGLAGDGGFPTGNGSGNGWEVGGGSNSSIVADAYFSNTSTLGAGVSGLSLGNAYNELTLAEDLVFTWTNSEGEIYNARVEYVGVAPDILPGDYNDDGTVNLGDYTVWRDNLGSTTPLPNDTTPGTVTVDDYQLWKSKFGTSGAGAGAIVTQPVPEPATCSIAVLALLGIGIVGARARK